MTLPSPGPSPPAADAVTWEESPTFTPRFGEDGLIPCITVDAPTGGVLMMAWMNAEALRLSLETGFVHYWSRSRQMLWKKGESSGAIQRIVDLRTDCDQDVVLVRVAVNDPSGTCHTGRPTCFYRSVPLGPGPLERSFEPADGGES